jgi:hypothetical protein
MSDVWGTMSARLREITRAARRDAVDHLAAGPREEASANVRALYELRQAVDDAIDAEVSRGREIGVQWDLLGPPGASRQAVQQRHRRAMARRQTAQLCARLVNASLTKPVSCRADFVNASLTGAVTSGCHKLGPLGMKCDTRT